MNVRIHTNLAGMSQEAFHAMHKVLTAGEPPRGLIFHSSAPIPNGWGVIDFWESRQDYDAALGRVQEAAAAAGVVMQGPPDIEGFPVHETFQP